MKRQILIFLLLLFLVGCGGGGGNDLASDADRFIGDWNGTMINTGRADGQPLNPNAALKMHFEYAGKEEIEGVMIYYITASFYADGVLFFTGIIQALPGGTLMIDLVQSDISLKMLGQFTGNTASGTYESWVVNPYPPYNLIHTWGTWSAAR